MNQAMKSVSGIVITLLWVFFLFSFPAGAQNSSQRGQGPITAKNERGQTIDLYSGSYALVIGVSDYTAGWKKLPGVRQDVEAVSAVLRQHGFQVTTVMSPTSAGMTQAIQDFVSQYGEQKDDRLLIYFAGHGETLTTSDNRQLGYLVPADAPPSRNSATFKRLAISMQAIDNYAQQIEAKHVLFVFDSCFSGMLFDSLRRGGPPPVISMKATQPVRQFITAGTSSQEVPDRSIFRQYFVHGLNGEADNNRDGYITGTELGDYLQDRVTNYSNNTQTPQSGKIRQEKLDKGDFVFLVPNGRPTRRVNDPQPSAPTTPERTTRPRPGTNDTLPQASPRKPPTIMAESNFFNFELRKCRISAPTIICDFLVTNREASRNFGVITGPFVNATRLWDNRGNVYYSSEAQLANQKYGGQLNTDVPTPLRITFKGEGTQGGTKISQLEMIFRFGQNDSSTIQFKDICLTDNCADASSDQGASRGYRERQGQSPGTDFRSGGS
jgi:uncharacterized caspase-like protein